MDRLTWPSLCRADAMPGVQRSCRQRARLSSYRAVARWLWPAAEAFGVGCSGHVNRVSTQRAGRP